MSNPSNDSTGGENYKVHGRFRRRDELLRSNRKLFVLGGALSILALCLVGMWASSTPIGNHAGSRRQRDERQRPRSSPRHERVDRKKRPRGTGYRKEEEMFPIPNNQVRESESREDEDEEDNTTQMQLRSPKNGRAGVLSKENLSEKNAMEGPPQERNERRHYKKVVDPDDDEDRANDESTEELSHDKKKVERAPRSEPKSLSRSKLGTNGGHNQSQPRVLRLQFEKKYNNKWTRGEKPKLKHTDFLLTDVHRLPSHEYQDIPSSDREVSPYPGDDKYFDGLDKIVKNSKKYRNTAREPLEDMECKPRHEWQRGAFPNCNILHEYEMGQLSGMFGRAVRKELRKEEGDGGELVRYLSHGYWRDVWLVSKASESFDTKYDRESKFDEEIVVMKTLRYRHDYTDRNYDRHRKDALASERLSKSPHVVDIFAYCSNSAIFEYGSGGDIEGKLWGWDDEEEKYYVVDMAGLEKIELAYQVAQAIADMHDVEDDGHASIAHTDITPSQFIFIDGRWKLNDFNRCRFMREHKEDHSVCGFHVGANPGKFRAPEEYNYEEEDEMIDVYSMGNIFYAILAGEMPFEGQKESKAQKKVMNGSRPKIPDEVLESDDSAIQALVSATKECWKQKPGDRPKASSIRDELKKVIDRIKTENANKKLSK